MKLKDQTVTKTIAYLSVAFLLGACATTGPTNGFGVMNGLEKGKTFYEVRSVSAVSPGTVQVVNRKGKVIGSAPVEAGANKNVRISFFTPISGQDHTAQLLVGGMVVDEATIKVRRVVDRDEN